MKRPSWLFLVALLMLAMGCIGGGGVQYTLTVEKQGQGTIDPTVGIYEYGEPHVMTLTATADDGWIFVGWEGDVSSPANQETTVAVDGQSVVKAVFAQQVSTLDGRTIVVDAGHGGRDPGAVGTRGYQEKDFTLSVARQLELLLNTTDANVILTRSGDEFVSLAQRANMSNAAQADFFLSIHANGHNNPEASGTETFYDGSWRAQQFALDIQKDMIGILGTKHRRVEAWRGLYVLGNTQAPAVLIEPGFVTNPTEELLLMDSAIQEELAESLYNNIIRHFGKK